MSKKQDEIRVTTQWDDRYDRGYGELMERDCEQERYRTIGQIVAALPAHSSLLDIGCGIGTMADYLPVLDYTGIDVSQKALTVAQGRHPGTFICSDAEGFRIDRKFDVILFNETLYYLEDPLEQLARYKEFLSGEGSMIISIWLPGFDHPNRARHSQLIGETITSDVFAQCPMRMYDIRGAELQWKAICVGSGITAVEHPSQEDGSVLDFKDLSPEFRERAKTCTCPEELIALTKREGAEIPCTKEDVAMHASESDFLIQNALSIEDGVLRCGGEPCLSEELRIPEGVVAIDNYCFAGSPNLKRVVLPSSVREIGVGAFSDCKLLESAILPKGILRLRKLLFSGCERLGSFDIPDGVTSIGEWAFRGCSNLQRVTVPASVIEICAESFLDCPALELSAPAGSYAEEYMHAMVKL